MSRRLAEPLRRRAAWPLAVVALGANLGDTRQTLDRALGELRALPLTRDVTASTTVESVALTLAGPDPAKPPYVNAVALVETRLAPHVLLAELHRIEDAHGRVRHERWGDRTLDLDLVAYGGVTSDDPRLTIPHPRAHERAFVLAPWAELDAGATIPGRGTVAELLAAHEAAS